MLVDNLVAQQSHWEVKQEQPDGSLNRSKIMESGEGFGKMSSCTKNDAPAIELTALINLKKRSVAARHYEERLVVLMVLP